jgi:hypothetical protein
MKREPPASSDDKAHLLLGALVRNVLRRGTDRLPRFPSAVHQAALGRGTITSSRWLPFAGGALAMGLLALVVMFARAGKTISYTRSGGQVRFSDGSDITVSPGGQLDVLGTTDKGGRLRLHGSGQLSVLGRPGALWSVEVGPYTVAAARATLDVGWSAAQGTLSIAVRSGHALLRGPLADRKEVRLASSQVLLASARDGFWRIESRRADAGPCPQTAAGAPGAEVAVHLDERGCLAYGYDDSGNRIPDFSHAGYRGGGVPLPFVPRPRDRPPLAPGGGDDTAAIQAAIDALAARTPDEDGFRGAVELGSGTFTVAGTLRLLGSGVVLRGQGEAGPGATVLRAVGSGRPVIVLGPSRGRTVEPAAHRISDAYVPVGARSFELDDPGDLAPGDEIVVQRPSSHRWLAAAGMGTTMPELVFERRITEVDGHRITIDVPLTNALEHDLTEATVSRTHFPDRVAEVGVERLAGLAAFDGRSDLGDGIFIDADAAMNAWVRQVRGDGFEGGVVSLEHFSKWVTVEDTTAAGPVLDHPRAWSRGFMVGGQQNLVLRGRTLGTDRAIETWARAAGPNVVLDLKVVGKSSLVLPSRWTNGLLLDGLQMTAETGELGGAIVMQNRRAGRDRGWAAANSVVWNCRAARLSVDSPPTAQNWVIGGQADEVTGSAIMDPAPARPESLYRAQLAERLGERATAALAR